MAAPIDPAMSVTGPEWSVGAVGQAAPGAPSAGTSGTSGASFGSLLSNSIQSLSQTQEDAATAAQQLATGQASDPTSVVMAVERAQLAMQMASQIRTKAVDAAQEIFHTQV
jgi:flagellar hook-basal body complex protein FliE